MTLDISVCLCTRNGERHLEEQLTSLAEQSLTPAEVLIGDDSSSDGTLAIVKGFAHTSPFPVLLTEHTTQLGHAANLDLLLSSASCDLVAICDQDDRWHPNKLRVLEQALRDDEKLGGAFADSALISAEGQVVGGTLWSELKFGPREQRQFTAGGGGFTNLLRHNVVAGHALVFRRDRLRTLQPVPRMHHVDWWIALELSLDGGLAPVPQILVDYRLHRSNAVGLRPAMSLSERLGSRDPRSRSQQDADLLKAFRDRLDERGVDIEDEQRSALDLKIAHARVRATLPQARRRRIRPIASELVTGGYGRNANGLSSAIMDMLAPPR